MSLFGTASALSEVVLTVGTSTVEPTVTRAVMKVVGEVEGCHVLPSRVRSLTRRRRGRGPRLVGLTCPALANRVPVNRPLTGRIAAGVMGTPPWSSHQGGTMTTSSISTSSSPGHATTETDGQRSTTDQAKHVAGVAGEEAKRVAGDVRDQAMGLLDETRNQVQDQSRTQRDRLVETLRAFSDDLEDMAKERGGLASNAAREVAQRARTFGQGLDGREPVEMLDDLRSFARRRPGTFLAGALVSGVLVGRLLRGARDAAQSGTPGSTDETASRDRSLASQDAQTLTATTTPPAPSEQTVTPPEGTAITSDPSGTVGTAGTETSPSELGRPVGGP